MSGRISDGNFANHSVSGRTIAASAHSISVRSNAASPAIGGAAAVSGKAAVIEAAEGAEREENGGGAIVRLPEGGA